MITARLSKASLSRLKSRMTVNPQKLEKIGQAMLKQVHNRYDTSGQSGGVTWPPGATDGANKPPLHGLRDTWYVVLKNNSVSVETRSPWAVLASDGNISKGGIRPDVVPKNAKRLFVPLNDHARKSYDAHKSTAPVLESIYAGQSFISQPKRDFTKSAFTGEKLVYGQDYILAKSVAQPPRPQIPNSPQEREALGIAIRGILASRSTFTHLSGSTADLSSMFGIELI